MSRLLLLLPMVLAACGGAEPVAPFAAGSPASTSAPGGQRVRVATMLEAEDPGEAARSPLLAAEVAAPAGGHEHHHHHHGASASPPGAATATPMTAPTAPAPTAPAPTATATATPSAPMTGHEHHQHGGGGARP